MFQTAYLLLEMIFLAIRYLSKIPVQNFRCLTLERGILQFQGELPSKLAVEADGISKKVAALGTVLDGMRNNAIPLTDGISKKINDAEYAMDSKVKTFFSMIR